MDTLQRKAFTKRIMNGKSIFFLLVFLTHCGLTEDTACKQQKAGERKCINAFVIFCSGNKTRTECNGSIESTVLIGGICKYDAPCQSSSDDLAKENIILKSD